MGNNSLKGNIDSKYLSSLEAVAFDEENQEIRTTFNFLDENNNNNNVPWIDMPKSFYQKKVTNSREISSRLLSSAEMYLGRFAMISTVILFLIEINTGLSIPEQMILVAQNTIPQ